MHSFDLQQEIKHQQQSSHLISGGEGKPLKVHLVIKLRRFFKILKRNQQSTTTIATNTRQCSFFA